MKLVINNFGPVRGKQDYVIDLRKDFSLITGGNGLGKTYLGYLLFGLIKKLKEVFFAENSLLKIKFDIDALLSGEMVVTSITRDCFDRFIDQLLAQYKADIHQTMGVNRRSADALFNDLTIEILNRDELYNDFLMQQWTRAFDLRTEGVFTYVKNLGSDEIQLRYDKGIETASNSFLMDVVEFALKNVLKNSLFSKSEIERVYYVPVERNSLYTFSKELSLKRSKMIDQLQSIVVEEGNDKVPDYLRKNANRYPEAIEDALKQAQDMSQQAKEDGAKEYIAMAEEIEQDILQGQVHVNKEGEVEFSPSRQKSKRVPVHMSASFIKTISSVVFYLRHVAQKGDLIMIDEPEMNLHPNLQISFIRILAKISNAGLKVWVSTHSDYMISEISNMCLVGCLNRSGQRDKTLEWRYGDGVYLDKDRIQALYFNDQKAKTQVKIENLEVSDQGVAIASMDRCLDQLNERSNELLELYDDLEA
ncbi:AAA family ATPase [Prolixibacteraceae bacterium]|nr:AAA family ATPase [Prolixibacteraceae bacterium]